MVSIFALILIIFPISSSTNIKLRVLPQLLVDKFDAKCLDGSPPSMHIQTNISSTKWVLFLEGGGWCYGVDAAHTIASCAARAENRYGSSKYNQLMSDTDFGGILSGNPNINPDFYSWNRVFLNYCDGSSFGGGNAKGIFVPNKNKTIWLRGRACFDGLITDLLDHYNMSKATEVILSGGSAGGLAVFYNLDHLATLLPKSTLLTGFPDAGFFLDAHTQNLDEDVTLPRNVEFWYRSMFQGADPVWNVTGSKGTNLACLSSQGSAQVWMCLMAEYIAPFVKTPLFIMNSAYDWWQQSFILKVGCLPKCTKTQLEQLNTYHTLIVDRITSAVATSATRLSGAFVDSCWVHEQNVNFCSGQHVPNCVGWSPLETGSKKWGYNTAIKHVGKLFTPQQAMGSYYAARKLGYAFSPPTEWLFVDDGNVFPNPTCKLPKI